MLQHQAERADGQRIEGVNSFLNSLSLGQGLKRLLLPRDYDPARRLFLKDVGLATTAALLLPHPLAQAVEAAVKNSIISVSPSKAAPSLREYQAASVNPVSTNPDVELGVQGQHLIVQWESTQPITQLAATFNITPVLRDGTTNVNTITCVGLIGNSIHLDPEYQGMVYAGVSRRGADEGYAIRPFFRRDLYLGPPVEYYEYSGSFGQDEDEIIAGFTREINGWRPYLVNNNRRPKLILTLKYPMGDKQISPFYGSVFSRFETGHNIPNYVEGHVASFRNIVIDDNADPGKQAGLVDMRSDLGEGYTTLNNYSWQTQADFYLTN